MSIWRAILTTIIYILLLGAATAWIFLDEDFSWPKWIYDYFELLATSLELLAVLLYLYFVNRDQGFHFGKCPAYYYPYALLFGLSYVFIQIPLNKLYYYFFDYYYEIQFMYNPERLLTPFFWSVVVLGPIGEELLFRGHIQRRLQLRYHPVVAISVATLLFALIHLNILWAFYDIDFLNPHHVYITIFGGMISGILYYLSKSIGPSIIYHMAWNFMATLF